jgi:hypothetical protein
MVIERNPAAFGAGRAYLLMGVALAGLTANPALAQSVSEPTNELAFSVALRHDNNLARAGSRRVQYPSDERATVGAEASIQRPLGRNTIAAQAFVGYDFYRKNTRLNRERISASVDASVNAGPCLVHLTPSFSRRQSEFSDLSFLDLPSLEGVRNTQTEQNYAGELRCGSATGLRPLVRYAHGSGNNSHPARKLVNFRSDTYAAGVGYSNVVLGDYDVSFERADFRHPNRPAALANGYRSDAITISGSRNIGSILVAQGHLAFTKLNTNGSAVANFKGITWGVSGTLTPLPALRVQGAFSQSVNPSLGTAALYSRNRNINLNASYALSSRTSVTLGAARATRLYRGDVGTLGPPLTNDRRDTFSGQVNFQPSNRLSFTLNAAHERRNANGTIYDYKNTYFVLTTRFSLGTP